MNYEQMKQKAMDKWYVKHILTQKLHMLTLWFKYFEF